MSNMKLIMENWRRNLSEKTEKMDSEKFDLLHQIMLADDEIHNLFQIMNEKMSKSILKGALVMIKEKNENGDFTGKVDADLNKINDLSLSDLKQYLKQDRKEIGEEPQQIPVEMPSIAVHEAKRKRK